MKALHKKVNREKEDKKILAELKEQGHKKLPDTLPPGNKYRDAFIGVFNTAKVFSTENDKLFAQVQHKQSHIEKMKEIREKDQSQIVELQTKIQDLELQIREEKRNYADMLRKKDSQLADLTALVGTEPLRKRPRINPDFPDA